MAIFIGTGQLLLTRLKTCEYRSWGASFVKAGLVVIALLLLSDSIGKAGVLTCSGNGNALTRNDIARVAFTPIGNELVLLKVWLDSTPEPPNPQLVITLNSGTTCTVEGAIISNQQSFGGRNAVRQH
jgi:hypothetical protein